MGLVMTLVSIAIIYITLNATFVAMVQMLVYAGAVMTLFLFVIMMIGVDKKEQSSESIKGQTFLVSGVFLILISILGYVAISSEFKWDLWFEAVEFAVEGTPQLIAGTLFTAWIFPFEIISILLIVATAAAIALAYDSKRRKTMFEVTTDWYLTLSAILFSIGFFGMMIRKNALIMFMCIELMLNAVNLTFISASKHFGQIDGQIAVFFVSSSCSS